MSLNLIDAAKALFTSEFISNAGSHLVESESGISKAIAGIVPAVLNVLLKKVSTTEGARDVAQMVRDQQNSNMPGNPEGLFTSENSEIFIQGSRIVSKFFGDKSDQILMVIAQYAGIKSSSSNSLFSIALPAILGLLGRDASGSNAGAIASLFNSQRSNIQAAVPEGLNLKNIFSNTRSSTTGPDRTRSSMGFLVPVLLILAALIAAYFLFGRGSN